MFHVCHHSANVICLLIFPSARMQQPNLATESQAGAQTLEQRPIYGVLDLNPATYHLGLLIRVSLSFSKKCVISMYFFYDKIFNFFPPQDGIARNVRHFSFLGI